jgi:hypothetical protein
VSRLAVALAAGVGPLVLGPLVLGALVLGALALAAPAAACVCGGTPLSERLDESDAAIVGRVVAEREGQVQGDPVKLLTVDVDQHVKGDLGGTIVVRSPSGSDCDVEVPLREAVGLLLTKGADGAWLASACSVVEPGRLVVEGGEPRGGVIKVGIGVVILALVLGWALLRLRRGKRPDLPGAPLP